MRCSFILLMVFFLIVSRPAQGHADDEDTMWLTYQDAVSIALNNNPLIMEARKTVQIMKARLRGSKRWTNPEVEVDISKIAFDLANDWTFDDRVLEGEIRITQPLTLWGKRRLTVRISEAGWRQAEYEFQRLSWLIRRKVQEQFNEAVLHQKRIALAKDHLKRAQRFFDQVHILYSAGKARQYELDRAKLEILNTQSELMQAETEFAIAVGELGILLGRTLSSKTRLQDNLSLSVLDAEMDQLIQRALNKRPDILAQNLELSKSRDQIELAARRKFPDVNLGFFVEREDEVYSAGVAISFDLPIWNRFQEEVQEKRVEHEIAKIRLEALKREVALEVYAAYMTVQTSRQTLMQRKLAVATANQLLQTLEMDYEVGNVTFLGYLEGLIAYREVQQNYLAALVDYRNKISALEQAVGQSFTGGE